MSAKGLALRLECGPDIYELRERHGSCWLVCGAVALRIVMQDGAVSVNAWPNGNEEGEPLASLATTQAAARARDGVRYGEDDLGDVDHARTPNGCACGAADCPGAA